jgi:uncharacterized protein
MIWSANTWRCLPVMEINDFHKNLSDILDRSIILAPPESLIASTGKEILGMAQCYLKDGSCFLGKDDPVNALASFAYAAGWLDAGHYIGIVTSGPLCKNLLSGRNTVPDRSHHHLTEKAWRYQRLLDSAITSSKPGSEPGIHWHEGGEKIIAIATAYATGGSMFLRTDRCEDALSCFSYGHGWLDASLRAGLIRITGNRDLFAI